MGPRGGTALLSDAAPTSVKHTSTGSRETTVSVGLKTVTVNSSKQCPLVIHKITRLNDIYKNMGKFTGRRALVTGRPTGAGIGRALTVKLVELGAEVFALSRTASHL